MLYYSKSLGVIGLNITIDFGNFWDMLSAIGTLLAVILSLWFSYQSNKPKLKMKLATLKSYKDLDFLLLTKGSADDYTFIEFGYIKPKTINHKCSFEESKLDEIMIRVVDGKLIKGGFPLSFIGHQRILIHIGDLDLPNDDFFRFYLKDVNGRIYKSEKIKL